MKYICTISFVLSVIYLIAVLVYAYITLAKRRYIGYTSVKEFSYSDDINKDDTYDSYEFLCNFTIFNTHPKVTLEEIKAKFTIEYDLGITKSFVTTINLNPDIYNSAIIKYSNKKYYNKIVKKALMAVEPQKQIVINKLNLTNKLNYELDFKKADIKIISVKGVDRTKKNEYNSYRY